MVYLLPVLLAILTMLIYGIYKDVLNPAFIFTATFFVASANLMSNVSIVGVTLHMETVFYIVFACIAFFIGTVITRSLIFKPGKRSFLHLNTRKEYNMNAPLLLVLLIFNSLSIVYILREVYSLTQRYAYYSGSLFGSLSVFAEVQKFGSIGLRVGTFSTTLTALLEAEAYVTGYIIVCNFVDRQKIKLLLILCFATSFISTFCQGSRGGVFILISLVFVYIMHDRRKRNTKRLGTKTLKKVVGAVLAAVVAFQIAGNVTGKTWHVPWYEYLSVYVGFPIYNLDVAITKGIPRTDIIGGASFGGLYRNILPRLGINFQSYTAYTGKNGFLNLNGHNMGNVYTILKNLIADFGYVGAIFFIVVLGMLMQLLYNSALRDDKKISMLQILFTHLLSCLAFSFFSNKICEAITVFHMAEFIFGYVWVILLTKKSKRRYRTNAFYIS